MSLYVVTENASPKNGNVPELNGDDGSDSPVKVASVEQSVEPTSPQSNLAPVSNALLSVDGESNRPPQTMGEPSSNGALESLVGEPRSVNTAASADEACDGQASSRVASNDISLPVENNKVRLESPSFSDPTLGDGPSDEVLTPQEQAHDLFNLRNVTRTNVAEILGAPHSDSTRELGKAYMNFFNFQRVSVVDALRALLERCSIVGETQAQERIVEYFAQRYAVCNNTVGDADAVHSLTAAVMLLNQDLHGQNLGKKMTSAQFQKNVLLLREDKAPIAKPVVKEAYTQIKGKPLQFTADDEFENASVARSVSAGTILLPNSVVEIDLDEYPTVIREGLLKRKNVTGGMGTRKWSLRYCVVRGFILHLFKADGRSSKSVPNFADLQSAIILTHALARPAINYHKRLHALQITDSSGQYHLFQASGYDDLMSWVIAINRASAIYSSQPLAAAVGSSSTTFERPVMPKHPSKASPEEQLAHYREKVDEIAQTLTEDSPVKTDKSSKGKRVLRVREARISYLRDELVRYQSYVEAMTLRHEFAPAARTPAQILSPAHSVTSMSSSAGSVSMASFHRRSGTPELSSGSSSMRAGSNSMTAFNSVHESSPLASDPGLHPEPLTMGTLTPPPGANSSAEHTLGMPGTRTSYREAVMNP